MGMTDLSLISGMSEVRMKSFFAGITFILAIFFASPVTAGVSGGKYPEVRPGILIVKFTTDFLRNFNLTDNGRTGISDLDGFLDDIDCCRIDRTYPDCLPPKPNGTDLTRIYTVYFDCKSTDVTTFSGVKAICDDLRRLHGVEYAEPWQIEKPDMEYNDPRRINQYGLDLVQSRKAHDIAIGDKNVPVAIVDTGMDMDHPDLVANLWINPGEDLNNDGIIQDQERNNRDDDQNGKVDDFNGWDFVDNDNYPEDFPLDYDAAGHGTHVAGITSAVTNNNEGVASVGYSCGIIPIRAGNQGIGYGYVGIEYAARTGAKVINCSWGGGWFSQQSQEVVNYAWENDAMVIAAAGNDDSNELHYPSGYDNVVAVAATMNGDIRAGFSNYGNWVDISAPGYEVFSTVVNARYGNKSGTSMASPFTAGVNILLRAAYPNLPADDILALLLGGADNIDDINPDYRHQLGVGRINAYNSLNLGPRPRLTISDLMFLNDDNENGRPDPGERVEVVFTFENGMDNLPAEGLKAVLSSSDPSINTITDTIDLVDILPGEGLTNDDNPFIIEISADSIPHTSNLSIVLTSYERLTAVRENFTIVIGQPDILIVDDDDGVNYQQYYCETVGTGNHGWVCWDVAQNGSPAPEDMYGYNMVIWTAADILEPLNAEERQVIETALNEGINLMLTGSRIGDDASNREFLANRFGAEHLLDSVVVATVEGLPGDRPFPSDVQMFLFGAGGLGIGRMSPSTMRPVNRGDSLAVYFMRERLEGVAGIYRYDSITRSKTVYLGFPFEGVSNVNTTREEALSYLYNWFMRTESADEIANNSPVAFSLLPAFPNPFNGSTRFGFNLQSDKFIRAAIYSTKGELIATITDKYYIAGNHILQWDASNAAAGLYLLKIDAGKTAGIEKLILIK